MKTLIVTVVCLIFSFVVFQTRADMYPVTAADKAFFKQVRKAVLTNDIKWLSEAVSYPLVLKTGKTEYKLKNKEDFAARAPLILTSHLKTTVQSQSPDSLFKNWQGVMIGNGEIWFSEVAETTAKEKTWAHRITRVNLPGSQSKATERGR